LLTTVRSSMAKEGTETIAKKAKSTDTPDKTGVPNIKEARQNRGAEYKRIGACRSKSSHGSDYFRCIIGGHNAMAWLAESEGGEASY